MIGFAQEVVGPCPQSLDDVVDPAVGSYQHDVDVAVPLAFAHLPAQFRAAHLGLFPVGNDDAKLATAQ
jgi:hypothetical protein